MEIRHLHRLRYKFKQIYFCVHKKYHIYVILCSIDKTLYAIHEMYVYLAGIGGLHQ